MFNLLLEAETPTPTGCSTMQYILFGILLVVFVGFFIWSTMKSRKRQKEEQDKIAALKVGDKVKTIGGICGIVVGFNDEENTFILETGEGENVSQIKFDKGAIYQTSSESDATAETDAENEPAEPFLETTSNDEETSEEQDKDKE